LEVVPRDFLEGLLYVLVLLGAGLEKLETVLCAPFLLDIDTA
jgi:hypothetical protein